MNVIRARFLILLLLALGAFSTAAVAQPFGGYAHFLGNHAYVRVPHHPSLNPATAFTFEAWVSLGNGAAGTCSSIAGKDWQESWWIGVCYEGSPAKPVLWSYLKGSVSARKGGTLHGTAHIAVVFNGSRRLHYINGEKVLEVAETGPLPASSDEMRIGSDVAWPVSPVGDIYEVRLWSIARTEAQIRSRINVPITTAQSGLVGVWSMNGSLDVVGDRDGTVVGDLIFWTHGSIPNCNGMGNATQVCLHNRFLVSARWRTSGAGAPPDGSAQVVPITNPGSGIFWFFNPNDWQVMVKMVDDCAVNHRYQIVSAATTPLYFELYVFDVINGVGKIYFSYPGPPGSVILDTETPFGC